MNSSSKDITIETEDVQLQALFELPADTKGLVIFAPGSEGGKQSPRNQSVARYLNGKGYGTLQTGLLTEKEAADQRHVFDIDLLSERLVEIAHWASRQAETEDLQIAFFASGTGGGAALAAASHLSDQIKAVVCCEANLELASSRLPYVNSPTLLLVGGKNQELLHLNQQAAKKLDCAFEISVLPDFTYLFEEAGALEKVAALTTAWFDSYLVAKMADADSTSHLSARP